LRLPLHTETARQRQNPFARAARLPLQNTNLPLQVPLPVAAVTEDLQVIVAFDSR
jgi:hypothetical protein